jgi:hypothetical protein
MSPTPLRPNADGDAVIFIGKYIRRLWKANNPPTSAHYTTMPISMPVHIKALPLFMRRSRSTCRVSLEGPTASNFNFVIPWPLKTRNVVSIELSPSTPPRRCRFRTLDHTANPWREQCFRRGPGDRKVEDLVGLLVRPRLSLSEISIQLACSRESGDASFMGDTLKLIWRAVIGLFRQELPRWRS